MYYISFYFDLIYYYQMITSVLSCIKYSANIIYNWQFYNKQLYIINESRKIIEIYIDYVYFYFSSSQPCKSSAFNTYNNYINKIPFIYLILILLYLLIQFSREMSFASLRRTKELYTYFTHFKDKS